jgi:sarcosine oxidase, subunit gamma
MTNPVAFARRTPLRTPLELQGATWTPLSSETAIAELPAQTGQAARLAIADLSPLPRLGFKGRETIAAMQRRGIMVEAAPNQAFRQPDGSLCLVLAPGEVILLSNLEGEGARLSELYTSWSFDAGERTYPLLRSDSHAWFAITGTKAPAMFAKICAIDLRPDRFSDLSIAQTSLAKLSAIIVRADIGLTPAYYVLCDSASAVYVLDCLLDAAQEFGGGLIGYQTLKALQHR